MNWSLLGTLIIASAIVAWAGDIIGMKLGRKRITFLKLRPKYTSRIISVLTGVGIIKVATGYKFKGKILKIFQATMMPYASQFQCIKN